MGNPPGERYHQGQPTQRGDVKLPQLATAERKDSPVGVASTETLVAEVYWEQDALPAGRMPHARAHQLVQRKKEIVPIV